jgi:preprotein translocase subunit SecB
MADQSNNNAANAAAAAGQPQAKVQILAQYIKDLSFENPNVGRLLEGPGESPNLKLEINVAANRLKDDLYESAIDFKANATSKAGVIYDLEAIYAGMFKIEQMPPQALEPFLLINCPTLLFPFLRRLVADLTREGGFPPLLLDPIDFGTLYMRKQQEAAAASKPSTSPILKS